MTNRGDRTDGDVIDQARRLFEAGQYAELLTTLNTTTSSADPAALLWLGRAQMELHDYAAAIVALERAVGLAPNDSEAHRWLGRAYGEEADRARSLSLAVRVRHQFEEAVRLDRTNIAAHRDLLQFYVDAPWIIGGGDGRARREISEIAAIDTVAGHLARAAYLQHRGERAQAAAEYRAVLDLKPADIGAYFEAAEFYEGTRDAGGLRTAIDAAADIDRDDPRELYYRGALAVMTRADAVHAEASLRAYLATPSRSDRPNAVHTHEWLGRLYEWTGSLAKAVAEYKAVLALAPGRKSAKEALRSLGQD